MADRLRGRRLADFRPSGPATLTQLSIRRLVLSAAANRDLLCRPEFIDA